MVSSAGAQTIAPPRNIIFPIDLLPDNEFAYYRELLVESLKNVGVTAEFQVHATVSQPRMLRDLQQGITALRPLLPSRAVDSTLVQVPVDLTGGRIGERILLVRPDERERFAGVTDLDQLRATGAVAILGGHWFDVAVWRANRLPLHTLSGDWSRIFGMLQAGGRDIDYFPRGVSEILSDAKRYPQLAIEPHLLLVYDRDFRFYLSRPYARYASLIESALEAARASGLMATLQQKYWGGVDRALSLDQRRRIHLYTPP
ncbi:hypothetical protein [Mangrovitalea sediminis]|uniref:hypothetical protein n=1 Tax=Mangrovitalea sediminis TaxID=1982043 RepID=UPI000BE569EA|nr:hypothetical protein [Mangrovitalea sediminis]